MQFEKNTDSNKTSVYNDLLFCSCLHFSCAEPPSRLVSSLSRPANLVSYLISWLSLKRNNCSRTMHLLEVLHIRQQHDTNRNKNTPNVKERAKEKLCRVFGKHLRAFWYRSFSQKLANRKTEASSINAQCLFQNILCKRFQQEAISNALIFFQYEHFTSHIHKFSNFFCFII